MAQPRGLVVLAGAGRIGPSVREFLLNDLNIRVEVPALEFSPTEDILGGPGGEVPRQTQMLSLDQIVLEPYHSLAAAQASPKVSRGGITVLLTSSLG